MQCCDTTAVHATALENGKQRSSGTGDNSLTSLKWLPQFKIAAIDDRKDAAAVTACNAKDLPPYSSSSDGASSTDSVTQESEPEKEECLLPLSPIKRCLNQTAEFDKNPSRFEENPNKPPFSYTTIIYLAIRSCNKDKVMLGDIYQWIKDHFKYYRVAESTWQNSVRHNLSLNQFFRKIPRSEGDPGKGSFWQINPDYEQLLNNDEELQRLVRQQNCAKTPLQRKRSKTRKKSLFGSLIKGSGGNSSRTMSCRQGNTMPTGEGMFSPSFSMMSMDPCHIPGGDLDWISLLSSQRMGCVSCACHHCRQGETGVHIGGRGEPPPSFSPLVVPLNKISDTPTFPSSRVLRNSLDDIITTQESPAPLLPPWTGESRPYSPTLEHPWAEPTGHSPFMRRAGHCSPVPEVMWSTNGSNSVQHTPGKLRIAQLI